MKLTEHPLLFSVNSLLFVVFKKVPTTFTSIVYKAPMFQSISRSFYLCLDVIHTVGPIGEQEGKLKSCYTKCLQLVKQHNLQSVVSFSVLCPIFPPLFPSPMCFHGACFAMLLKVSIFTQLREKYYEMIFFHAVHLN